MEFYSRQEGWQVSNLPDAHHSWRWFPRGRRWQNWLFGFLPSVWLDQFGFGFQRLQDFTKDPPDLELETLARHHQVNTFCFWSDLIVVCWSTDFFFLLIFYFPYERKVSGIVCQATWGLQLTPPSNTNGMAANQHQLTTVMQPWPVKIWCLTLNEYSAQCDQFQQPNVALSSHPGIKKPQWFSSVAHEEKDVILKEKSIKSTAWLLIKTERSENVPALS